MALAQRGHRPSAFTVGRTFQQRWHLPPSAVLTDAWMASPTVTSSWETMSRSASAPAGISARNAASAGTGRTMSASRRLPSFFSARAVSRTPVTTSRTAMILSHWAISSADRA